MSTRLVKEAEASKLFYVPYRVPFIDAELNPAGTHAPAESPVLRSTPPKPPAELAAAAAPINSKPDFGREPDELIEEAQIEAARLIAEARHRASEIEAEACERGLIEGRTRLTAEVEEASRPLRERLTSSLAQVADLHSTIAARAERDLVQLAVEIAKKIVHREVTVDREVALTLARVALARLHTRTLARVHLHPEDYAYLGAHHERLGSGSIEIVEDSSVGRGGCLVRTEMGDLDATIEQQFAEIERGFLSL